MADYGWVIDASVSDPPLLAFCPLEEDGAVVVGLTFVSTEPPNGERVVGVFHPDGADQALEWLTDNSADIDHLSVPKLLVSYEDDDAS